MRKPLGVFITISILLLAACSRLDRPVDIETHAGAGAGDVLLLLTDGDPREGTVNGITATINLTATISVTTDSANGFMTIRSSEPSTLHLAFRIETGSIGEDGNNVTIAGGTRDLRNNRNGEFSAMLTRTQVNPNTYSARIEVALDSSDVGLEEITIIFEHIDGNQASSADVFIFPRQAVEAEVTVIDGDTFTITTPIVFEASVTWVVSNIEDPPYVVHGNSGITFEDTPLTSNNLPDFRFLIEAGERINATDFTISGRARVLRSGQEGEEGSFTAVFTQIGDGQYHIAIEPSSDFCCDSWPSKIVSVTDF